VSACGGGGGEEAERKEAEVRTVPAPGKSLAAGTYATGVFEPALSFKVGEGWISIIPEARDAVAIGKRDVPLSIGAVNVEQVFDPGDPGRKVAAPGDMAA